MRMKRLRLPNTVSAHSLCWQRHSTSGDGQPASLPLERVNWRCPRRSGVLDRHCELITRCWVADTDRARSADLQQDSSAAKNPAAGVAVTNFSM